MSINLKSKIWCLGFSEFLLRNPRPETEQLKSHKSLPGSRYCLLNCKIWDSLAHKRPTKPSPSIIFLWNILPLGRCIRLRGVYRLRDVYVFNWVGRWFCEKIGKPRTTSKPAKNSPLMTLVCFSSIVWFWLFSFFFN